MKTIQTGPLAKARAPEPPDPMSLEAEEAEELRAFYEARDLEMLREAIGRVVLTRVAAFDAATPGASKKDSMGVTDLLRWLGEDLSADELKLFAAATFDAAKAAPVLDKRRLNPTTSPFEPTSAAFCSPSIAPNGWRRFRGG
jgi:hypothetical protein